MARYFVLIGFLSGILTSAGAQDSRVIDSLETVLKFQTGKERFATLYELVFQYISNDNEKALEFAEQAQQAAFLTADSLWIVKSARVRAQLLYALGRIPEALTVATPLAERPNLVKFGQEYFNIANLLGSCHVFLSRFDKALEYFFLGYERAKEADNNKALSVSLANIGLVYYKLKDYSRAASYYDESRALKDRLNIVDVSTRMNLSLCYTHLGKFIMARHSLDESLKACGQPCPSEKLLHIRYASGCIFFGLGKLENAEEEFLQSLALSRQTAQTRLELDNIYMLTKIYIQQGQFFSAKELLEVGEDIVDAGTPFNLEAIKMYEQLSELFLALGDFKKASAYQSRYIHLKDSVYNEAVTASLMKVESGYVEWKNSARISKQEQIIRLKNEVIRREKASKKLSWIIVLLVMTLLGIAFKHYRRNKTITSLLDKKIAERTRELELSRNELQSLVTEEKLRMKRISGGIVERLNTLIGLCNVAHRQLSDLAAQECIDRISEATVQFNSYLRLVFEVDTQNNLDRS